MRVSFEPAASDDLDRLFSWIAKDSPRATLHISKHSSDERSDIRVFVPIPHIALLMRAACCL